MASIVPNPLPEDYVYSTYVSSERLESGKSTGELLRLDLVHTVTDNTSLSRYAIKMIIIENNIAVPVYGCSMHHHDNYVKNKLKRTKDRTKSHGMPIS